MKESFVCVNFAVDSFSVKDPNLGHGQPILPRRGRYGTSEYFRFFLLKLDSVVYVNPFWL